MQWLGTSLRGIIAHVWSIETREMDWSRLVEDGVFGVPNQY